MPVEFTTVDWILMGGMAALAVVGFLRGISSELGSLLGLSAGVLAGFLLYGPAQNCAQTFGFGMQGPGMLKGAAIAIDCVLSLLIGGGVRLLVRKFVSFLMGKAIDHGLGLLSGLIKGVLIVGVLTGFGLIKAGDDATGPLAAHSPVITMIASLADAYVAGTAK